MAKVKESYSFAKKLAKINKKRQEAKERAAIWNKLSVEEKLASLAIRRGESKRQVAKLSKMLKR